MKKIITLLIGLTLTLPLVASAATFVVVNPKVSYNAGDLITLKLAVNPEPNTSYTSMLDANFSTDTLEVVSFFMNGKMLELKQSGYDVVDNVNGSLVKTGGYTGGIKSQTSYGTLVLRAKNEGTGTFTINDNSKILDENNVDRQSGSQTISFNIGKYIPLTNVGNEIVTPISTSTEATTTVQEKELLSKNNLLSMVIFLILIIILLILSYYVKHKKENK